MGSWDLAVMETAEETEVEELEAEMAGESPMGHRVGGEFGGCE